MPGPATQFAMQGLAVTSVAKAQFLKEAGMGLGMGLGLGIWGVLGLAAAGGLYLAYRKYRAA